MTSALDLRLRQLSKPLTSSDQGRATEQSLPQAITTPATTDSATENSPTDSIQSTQRFRTSTSTRPCQSTTSATLWAYHGSLRQLTATNRQARPRTSANQFNSIDVDATMPIDYVRHIMGVSWIAPSIDSDKPSSPATDVSNRATRSRSELFHRGLLAGHPDSLRQTLTQFR